MSLKYPRDPFNRRCAGGEPQCVGKGHDWLQPRRRIGQCPSCRRWFDVSKKGRIRPHLDYGKRDERFKEPVSADAVDPHAGSTGTLSTREKGS